MYARAIQRPPACLGLGIPQGRVCMYRRECTDREFVQMPARSGTFPRRLSPAAPTDADTDTAAQHSPHGSRSTACRCSGPGAPPNQEAARRAVEGEGGHHPLAARARSRGAPGNGGEYVSSGRRLVKARGQVRGWHLALVSGGALGGSRARTQVHALELGRKARWMRAERERTGQRLKTGGSRKRVGRELTATLLTTSGGTSHSLACCIGGPGYKPMASRSIRAEVTEHDRHRRNVLT
eukprot:667590-Rhodomonas_salina.4